MSTSGSHNEESKTDSDAIATSRRQRKKRYMMAALVGIMYSEKYLMKKKRGVPIMTGQQWVTENLSTPKDCYNMFRMYKPCFDRLHHTLVHTYGLKGTRNMNSEEALGMFLWTVGGPQSASQVENHFKRSTEVIHHKFNEVLKCLNDMAVDIIRSSDPQFRVVHDRLQDESFAPQFDGCIGAMDGSHIPVIVLNDEMVNHVGRHGYPTQNIMAVCDFDMRFTSSVAGWPGSAHDTRIFGDTLVKYADRFPHPPIGRYYLVDSGYPNCDGYLAPYKGQKYHVPEFCQGLPPNGKKETFNFAHSSLCNVIEHAFGVFKMKWHILLKMPSYSCEKQARIIIACMALHNCIRESHLRDLEFDKCDRDENYMSGNLQPPPIGHVSNIVVGDDATVKATREAIANGLFADQV